MRCVRSLRGELLTRLHRLQHLSLQPQVFFQPAPPHHQLHQASRAVDVQVVQHEHVPRGLRVELEIVRSMWATKSSSVRMEFQGLA